MPFTSQILPAEELNAMKRDLQSFKSVASMVDSLVAAAQNTTLGHNIQVFTLGVQDIQPGGAGLAAATAAGWRLAASVGGQTIACDLYTVARGGSAPLDQGAPRLACVRAGAPVDRLMAAMTSMQQIDGQPANTEFTIRLLIMPALFTDALWLLPLNLDLDSSRLIAYDTLVEGLITDIQYSPTDFLNRLAPVAQYWKDHPVLGLEKPPISTF